MANRRIGLINAVTIISLAIGVPTRALADVELEPIGTFDNWIAYKLSDGNHRVCFAETHLVERSTPDERIESARLMVTHQAMGYGGDMVRVSIDEAPFEDADEFLLSFGDNGNGHPFHFDDRTLPRWTVDYADIVQKIKAAESARRPATLGDADRFSLSGFSEAYEAIQNTCPTASDTRVPEPAYVSEILLEPPPPAAGCLSEDEHNDLYREWLSKEPYIEVHVIGRSFFGGDQDEYLTLRFVIGNEEARPDVVVMLADERTLDSRLLSIATRRVDYFRNGKLLDSDDFFSHSYGVQFGGACEGPHDGRLNLLFSHWSGAASFDMEHSAIRFEPNEGISRVSIRSSMDAPLQIADCAKDQRYWEKDGVFSPCVCRDWDPSNPYNSDLAQWRRGLASIAQIEGLIDGEKLSSFLDSTLVPFMRWDARVHLDVRHFESTEYDVVSVTFKFGPEMHDMLQVVLASRANENDWFKIYDADVYRGGVHEVEIRGFEAPHLLKRSGGQNERNEDQFVDLNKLLADAHAKSQIEP